MARKLSRILGAVSAIGLALFTAPHAFGFLTVEFSGATPGYNSIDESVGYSFTPNTNVMVNALDFINPVGTGGDVRIYDASATTLVSATVLPTDPTESVSGYTYNVHSISPFTLDAGTTYYIVADVPASQDSYPVEATGLLTDPRIDFGTAVAELGSLGNPLTDLHSGALDPAYLAPNFDLVPEPASLSMLIGGVLLTLRRRRVQ
jgi:hypothetical protein